MSKVDVVSAAIQPRLRLNLVARVDIAPGEAILECLPSEVTHQRTWRTLQIDYNRGVKNEWLDYGEHSCDPNAVVEVGRPSLVALRPIKPGESITFFYPGAEVEMAQDFMCTCGSPGCIGHLKGAFYLTAEQMRSA